MKVNGCHIPDDRAQHFANRATPEEVFEVLENDAHRPAWRRTRSLGRSPAFIVYGRTETGRHLTIPGIVFSEPPLENVFMPVTVRDMTSSERRYYRRNERSGRG